MGVRFIREPSEAPNVVNQDDFRLFRYAVGGYNGYIKGRGTEFGYVVNGTVFKITSGVGILHGVDFEVDTNGWELDVGNLPTKRYFSVYAEVNLATNNADIKSTYDTTNYPTISQGDDLTATPTGTARLLLYTLTAQNGVIANVSKKITPLPYYKDLIAAEAQTRANSISNLESSLKSYTDNAIKGTRAPLIFSSKFTSASGYAYKLGNLIIIQARGVLQNGNLGDTILTIPNGYRPSTQLMDVIHQSNNHVNCYINTNGSVTYYANHSVVSYAAIMFFYFI